MRSLLYCFFSLLLTLPAISAHAHPMPHSALLLDIKENGVAAELQWPLKEMQLIFPGEQLDTNVQTLIQRKGPWLDGYLRRHLHVTDQHGRPWTWEICGKHVSGAEQEATGRFHELVFNLWMQPPAGSSPRHFTVLYDAIMHQLVTHKMYVSIRQDWDGGLSNKDSNDAQLGIVMMNIKDNSIKPLIVKLDEGGMLKGLRTMVALGIEHISEGTDHLLFLLVLLLPAPLIARAGRWAESGGTRYSILRLLKIATAFTIGHSATLLAGALGWLRLPQQPVEVLIAVSILITAVHAIRPLFPGREMYVAAGFGLVHGLAFATALSGLHLDGSRLALSILGFNIGIELMQLFVILLFVPWLIILSAGKGYSWLRIGAALIAGTASLAWIRERAFNRPNAVADLVAKATRQGKWMVLGLASCALLSYLLRRQKEPSA